MPFLFIDYDQGMGGERFCAGISQSPQCETLTWIDVGNNRIKVFDLFGQEFLKPTPKIQAIHSHPTLYSVVPTHRKIKFARQWLQDVKSIRLQLPDDDVLYQKIKQNQIDKVILAGSGTQELFFGNIHILDQKADDPDWKRHVRYSMTYVELYLLSQGIAPTKQNIDTHVNNLRSVRVMEPSLGWDLTIRYEDIVNNPDIVCKQIHNAFDIDIVGDWIYSYASN